MASRLKLALIGLGVTAAAAGTAAAVSLAGCGSTGANTSGSHGGSAEVVDAGPCPREAPAPQILPEVRPEERTAAYWVARAPEPDEVVLDRAAIEDHQAAFRARLAADPKADPLVQEDLLTPPSEALLRHELEERLAFLRERLEGGSYVDAEGRRLEGEALAAFATPTALPARLDEIRVALAPLPLYCGPRAMGLYKGPEVDRAFDRNLCSTIRPQEPVRILGRWPGGMLWVRTAYAYGWLSEQAALSPPLRGEDRARFVRGPRRRLVAALTVGEQRLEPPTRVVMVGDQARIAGAQGLSDQRVEVAVERPLTRRALIEEAFAYLDSPYGWGGKDGGRDCSRFLMDVFASFGLELPRHSKTQSEAGSMVIDLTEAKDREARLGIIDAAQARGIVLLHFPGHIMLYLGRNAAGQPMAMHAFAEYLERCSDADRQASGRDETLRRVDRVQVSDLSLGQGTTRTSFLERITHVTLFAQTPGAALQGAVRRRPAAPVADVEGACRDSDDVLVITSPRKAHVGEPLRILVAAQDDLGPTEIAVRGPDGAWQRPPVERRGGPPHGFWAEIEEPAFGRHRILVGDGQRVAACAEVDVYEEGDRLQANQGRVWTPHRKWTRGIENVYALFIERLFDHPLDDRTWPNLTELLADRSHNLLYGYLGQGEEEKLALQPDCADLPYFLRAYYAWKLRLPFAYRHCNRGFEGKAPYCDREVHDNLATIDGVGTEVGAFGEFARNNVANGVHSGSGRCGPEDSNTDYYPIPLTREAIRPGVIFADPYGHLFVIAGWKEQTVESYGILVGADAQPDGTIGRRRFWPGSFLFTPDTREAGAGFKAFRPARYAGGRVRQYDNASIAGLGLTPFSLEQYQGSKQDFYDRVEALINPRPLEPKAMLDVLISALYEQVKRRVVSVQNAEDYKAGHRGAIDMPRGHSIFETSGAWEDFSTPSRDMRLLIAMDTVLGFPDAVKRTPERFGIAAGAVEGAVADLEAHMKRALAAKTFQYRRSDGSDQALTVADVVARARDFEVAYNPNDCVEIRWAAPEGSAERATCQRQAPGNQRRLMTEYRPWFAQRRRPPR